MPDIVAIAKPIAAGLPLGAFLAREEFASAISPGQHGTTRIKDFAICRRRFAFLDELVREEIQQQPAPLESGPRINCHEGVLGSSFV